MIVQGTFWWPADKQTTRLAPATCVILTGVLSVTHGGRLERGTGRGRRGGIADIAQEEEAYNPTPTSLTHPGGVVLRCYTWENVPPLLFGGC